jgi:hypothetical protein
LKLTSGGTLLLLISPYIASRLLGSRLKICSYTFWTAACLEDQV